MNPCVGGLPRNNPYKPPFLNVLTVCLIKIGHSAQKRNEKNMKSYVYYKLVTKLLYLYNKKGTKH